MDASEKGSLLTIFSLSMLLLAHVAWQLEISSFEASVMLMLVMVGIIGANSNE